MRAQDVDTAKTLLDLLKNLRQVEEKSSAVHGNLRVEFSIPNGDYRERATIDGYPHATAHETFRAHATLVRPMLAAAIEDIIQRLTVLGVTE